MSALLLALASSMAWGTADFMGGLQSRRLPIWNVLVVSQIFGLTAMVIAVAVHGADPPSTELLLFAIASGFFSALGVAAFYRALAIGNMGVVAPIAATSAAIPVAVGIIGGDRLAVLQAVGMVIAFIGVVVASLEEVGTEGGDDQRVARGVGMALLAAVGFGGFLALIDKAGDGGVDWAVMISRSVSFTLFVTISLVTATRIQVRSGRQLTMLIAIGLLEVAANLMFAAAATSGLISLVAVLGSLYPVATIALAFGFLKERPHRLAILGVVATMVGVVLITAG